MEKWSLFGEKQAQAGTVCALQSPGGSAGGDPGRLVQSMRKGGLRV